MSFVPDFFVYGEPAKPLDVGFLHAETVMERENVHHGVVKPHKHEQLAQITFWTKGQGSYVMDSRLLHFSAPAVSFVPAGIIHGFTVVPEESDAIVVSIANGAMLSIGEGSGLPTDMPVMVAGVYGDALWSRLHRIMDLIIEEYTQGGPGMERTVPPLITAALAQIARLGSGVSPLSRSASHMLAARLRQAVDRRFRENWTVAHYVESLGTTPHLLSKACEDVFGTTIKAVIDERRLLEAKRLLLFTVRSVEDIGYEIGMRDAAYFSRFFRKKTGQAPGEWRKRQADVKPD